MTSDTLKCCFTGVTTKSKPTYETIILTVVSLDISSVLLNSGIKKDITNHIDCPKSGVYFISANYRMSGTKIASIYAYVTLNLKKVFAMGMGSFTMDYIGDDHAFIYCNRGDNIAMLYSNLGDGGRGSRDPYGRITVIFFSHSGNSIAVKHV